MGTFRSTSSISRPLAYTVLIGLITLLSLPAFAQDPWPRLKYKNVVRWRYVHAGAQDNLIRRPFGMSAEVAVDTAIKLAVRTMQKVVRDAYGGGISIVKENGPEAEIEITWEGHGLCNTPGYSGTAGFDTSIGTYDRITLNNQLKWTILLPNDPTEGCDSVRPNYYDLETAILHELGHAFLGVGHSDNTQYVMQPGYTGKRTQFDAEEELEIRRLYNGSIKFQTDFGGSVLFKPGASSNPQLVAPGEPTGDTTSIEGWYAMAHDRTILRHPFYLDSIRYVNQQSSSGEVYHVFHYWKENELATEYPQQSPYLLNDFKSVLLRVETRSGFKTVIEAAHAPVEEGVFSYTVNGTYVGSSWAGFVFENDPVTFKCLGPDPRWKPLEWRDTTGIISKAEELVLAPTAPIKNLRAVMKAHLGSTHPTVTAKTNQRKTAYVPGSYYFGIVYESADQIWAGTVHEELSSEIMETRVSSQPTATLKAKGPSLAYDRENRFYVSWQETEDLGGEYEHRIYMRPYNAGMGSEGPAELVAVWNAATNVDAAPSISYGRVSGTGNQARMLVAIYKTHTGLKLSTRRLIDTSWATISIPFTGNAVNASVALEYSDNRAKEYGHLVYELNGQIRYYRVELYNWPTMTLQNSANLSAEYSNFLSNSKPTIALKPGTAHGMDTIYVAWSRTVNPSQLNSLPPP